MDKDLYNRSQNCIREGQRILYDHEALSSVTDVLCIVCKKDTATTMPKTGYSIMDGSNNINDAIADRIKSHMEEQHKVAVNLI